MITYSRRRLSLTAAISAALISPGISAATFPVATASPSHHLAQSRPPRPSRPPAGLVSGATRGECPITNPAIAPDDNHISHVFPLDSEYGYASYTASNTPRLWVYIPYTIDENSPVEFVLKQAETRETVYSSGTTAIATNAGLVGFDAPIILEPNVGYEWIVRVYCNDTAAHNPSQFVKGGIMYTTPPGEYNNRYNSWYDELNEIVNTYTANPNNAAAQAAWTEMLTETELANRPETSVQSIINLRTPE